MLTVHFQATEGEYTSETPCRSDTATKLSLQPGRFHGQEADRKSDRSGISRAVGQGATSVQIPGIEELDNPADRVNRGLKVLLHSEAVLSSEKRSFG